MMSNLALLLLCAVVLSPSTTAFAPPRLASRVHYNKQLFFDNDNSNKDVQLLSNDSPQLLASSGLFSAFSNVLTPAAVAIDDATNGFALAYADLSPETESTSIGQLFLATNVAYTIMGLFCLSYGNVWFGAITEAASVASFAYHYNQLANPKDSAAVRLVLMIDYVFAFSCLGTASWYLITDFAAVPIEALIASGLAIFFLGLSWIWEAGVPYCINHGLWHLFGAYGGYLIAQAHATSQIV